MGLLVLREGAAVLMNFGMRSDGVTVGTSDVASTVGDADGIIVGSNVGKAVGSKAGDRVVGPTPINKFVDV